VRFTDVCQREIKYKPEATLLSMGGG
jgi:hypothetical protein